VGSLRLFERATAGGERSDLRIIARSDMPIGCFDCCSRRSRNRRWCWSALRCRASLSRYWDATVDWIKAKLVGRCVLPMVVVNPGPAWTIEFLSGSTLLYVQMGTALNGRQTSPAPMSVESQSVKLFADVTAANNLRTPDSHDSRGSGDSGARPHGKHKL